MPDGPDIARIAALIGDPVRANMLSALIDGRALTARELAREAGVSLPTASAHVKKLAQGGLTTVRHQGRHRYVALASDDVAALMERLAVTAHAAGQSRARTGPRDAAMREARVCYNHLAGHRAVRLYASLAARGAFRVEAAGFGLTPSGRALVDALGVDLEPLERGRAKLCHSCLDWSERRSHLSGSLGRSLLARFEALGWLTREAGSRTVVFTPKGGAAFDAAFPV